jgi:hypothetical protein
VESCRRTKERVSDIKELRERERERERERKRGERDLVY